MAVRCLLLWPFVVWAERETLVPTEEGFSMDTPQLIANRFRVEREIGRGGMGTVYRATHLGLERPVAVKIL